MTNVLVTGSSGQLGSALRKISSDPLYASIQFTFKEAKDLDITDFDQLESEFSKGNYDYCINCAAYTNVEMAEKNPEEAFRINEGGAQNVARACKKHQAILIHISTDYVFDGTKTSAYTPADTPNPINQYGRSKWEGEKRIQSILTKYFIVRTSWLYSEYGHNFYKTIIKKAKQREKLFVNNTQIGCPTHAINLSIYILNLISEVNTSYGIHHFTDGIKMSWFDFAKRILEENNLQADLQVATDDNYRSFAARPLNSVLLPNPLEDS